MRLDPTLITRALASYRFMYCLKMSLAVEKTPASLAREAESRAGHREPPKNFTDYQRRRLLKPGIAE